nr:heme A synthase [Mucilaginibacter sp. X5P1]
MENYKTKIIRQNKRIGVLVYILLPIIACLGVYLIFSQNQLYLAKVFFVSLLFLLIVLISVLIIRICQIKSN